MNSFSPVLNESPKAMESVEAHIAVAVIWFPGEWTVTGHQILCATLRAGLRRKPVQIVDYGAFFKPIFSVSLIKVLESEKSSALEAIRQTLSDLELMDLSTIAVRTAEEIWLTIHGVGVGGTTFDQAFLREEDIATAKAEIKESAATAKFMWSAFIEDWKRSHPHDSFGTDTK